MKTRIIEATTGPKGNWGKFIIGRFDEADIDYVSVIAPEYGSILRQRGWWTPGEYFLMLDIQTGEGAIFATWGDAHADLNKHRIWVCPLFEPTLREIRSRLKPDVELGHDPFDDLPDLIELTFEEAPFAMQGYRRMGRTETTTG